MSNYNYDYPNSYSNYDYGDYNYDLSSANNNNNNRKSADLVGAFSSGGGDCCPPVVDPLTFLALLGFIAAATYFLQRKIII